MTLVKDVLKAALLSAANVAETASKAESPNNESIKEIFADSVATAIDTYIKSATVSTPVVAVITGSATPAGVVTGTANQTSAIGTIF